MSEPKTVKPSEQELAQQLTEVAKRVIDILASYQKIVAVSVLPGVMAAVARGFDIPQEWVFEMLELAFDDLADEPEPRRGCLSAEERASMFVDWCALHKFPRDGGTWPDGAFEELVAHIRRSDRPFPLTRGPAGQPLEDTTDAG